MNTPRATSTAGRLLISESGVLSFVLVFCIIAGVAIVGMLKTYSIYKQELLHLRGIAQRAALEGGSGLPDPVLTKQKIDRAIRAVNGDGHISVEYYFTSAKGNRIPCAAPSVACDDTVIPSKVEFPIKSVTVKLTQTVAIHNWGYLFLGFSDWIIEAERTVGVTPMDVVLIVENSNSLISPLAQPLPSPHHAFSTDANVHFEQEFSPTYGGNISAAERFARACYGQTAYNVKAGAVGAYDYLSSSSQIRVAVVNPLSSNLEQAPVAVPFLTHPFARRRTTTYLSNKDSTVNAEYSYFGIDYNPDAGPNHSYFLTQNPGDKTYLVPEEPICGQHSRTRCAALTDVFPVPKHFLSSELGGGTYNMIENFFQVPGGNSNSWIGESIPSSTEDPYWMLTFKPVNPTGTARYSYSASNPSIDTGRLLPREAIWIHNSGYQTSAGNPIPEFNYISWGLSFLKSQSMLISAPPRKDQQPVRKKVAIALADGLDKHQRPFGASASIGYPQVHVISKNATPNVYDLQFDMGQGDLACDWQSRIDDPNLEIVEVANSQAFPNDPDRMKKGLKLGFAFYSFGGAAPGPGSDPFLASLQDHYFDSLGQRLSDFRDACTQPFHERRGKFFSYIDPNASTSLPAGFGSLSGPADYQILIKLITRTLVTPIILQ